MSYADKQNRPQTLKTTFEGFISVLQRLTAQIAISNSRQKIEPEPACVPEPEKSQTLRTNILQNVKFSSNCF